MLNINEIFYTIQGEGPFVGKPAIFIRLAGCNLRCYWCDTSYTWLYSEKLAKTVKSNLPSHLSKVELEVYDKNEEIHKMSIPDIITKISSYTGDHIVISGGEPLLQKKKLIEFTKTILKNGYSIEIETNGTISPVGFPNSIHFNVSPKLQNSYNDKDRRYKPKILQEFLNKQAIFKFVVSDQSDLTEIESIITDIGIPNELVYLMPEGRTTEELLSKAKWLIPICKENNYRYTHRLHIDLFDETRGV